MRTTPADQRALDTTPTPRARPAAPSWASIDALTAEMADLDDE